MNYKVFSIPPFEKQLKKLVSKYPSLKDEFSRLISELETNPMMGARLVNSCYKIRVAIQSKGKGKRSGGRIITYVHITEQKVYLLSVYDKSEQTNISDNELNYLLSYII